MRQTITDLAIILSRVDYGEKDRILTVLTPNHGKLRAIAKSVRSGKSKLAGGIELFAENELGLASGRGELYTVTHSRMKRYFGDISKDTDSTMYAYECLKTLSRLAPDHAGGDYYDSLARLLEALDAGKIPFEQIKLWYGLKLLENLGASPNFKTDSAGKPLAEGANYQYDLDKHCFFQRPDGQYGEDHIKVLRHLTLAGKPVKINNINQKTNDLAERLITLEVKNHFS